MRVLSLFDGMACGMLAMQSAGLAVDRYVAFEIDKYAVQTSSHNFPLVEHRGDVFQADFKEFAGFDFLVGGSPCTYWSIAQKNNRETVASGIGWELFSQYVRALHEAQPRFFIYENNKSMSKAIRDSIDQTFGFEAVCINSALVSAQNRQRLYWVGKRNPDGTYSKVHVDQPEDRYIFLKDVLDGLPFGETNGKGYAQTASCYKGQPLNKVLEKSQRTHVAEPVCVAERGRYTPNGIEQRYEARQDRKTNVLTTVQKDNNVCEPVRIGTYPRSDGVMIDHQQSRIYAIDAKSTNLNANGGGQGAKTGLYAIPVEFYGDIPTKAVSGSDGKTYDVYRVQGGEIAIKEKSYPIKLPDGYYIIRKLTVTECKRLQTVPGWYEFPVSDTQAYKMLGNGWTVEVISHLIQATQLGTEEENQLSLFEMNMEVAENA